MTQSDELERIRLQLLQDGYDEDAVSDAILKLVERGEVPSMSLARRIAWTRVMDEKRRQRIVRRGAPPKLDAEGRQLERASARQELERLGPVAINPHLPEEDSDMAYDRSREDEAVEEAEIARLEGEAQAQQEAEGRARLEWEEDQRDYYQDEGGEG